MKNKIMLFDAEGTQMGETFMRRARQLVSQQRAEWINDGAIRFLPDVDVEESEWNSDVFEEPKTVTSRSKSDSSRISEMEKIARASGGTDSEALLYYIAEQRIRERKAFVLHSIFMIPGYIVFLILALMMGRQGELFLLATWSAWTTPYLYRAFVFIRARIKESRPEDHARQLEMEVDKLRRSME